MTYVSTAISGNAQQSLDLGRPFKQASLTHEENLSSLQLCPSFDIETLLYTILSLLVVQNVLAVFAWLHSLPLADSENLRKAVCARPVLHTGALSQM